MKLKRLKLMMLFLCLFGLIAARAEAQGIVFQEQDVPSKIASARKAGKPVLIYFKVTGSEACQKLEKKVFDDKRAGDCFNDKVVCCAIDVNADPSLARSYGISRVPSVVMLDRKGDVIYGMMGGVFPPHLILLGNVLTGESPSLPGLYDVYRKDKTDMGACQKLLLDGVVFLKYLPLGERNAWKEKLFKAYRDYRKVRPLEEMVNLVDYTILTSYSCPEKEMEVFNFIVANADRYKEVVNEKALLTYLLNTNNALIQQLARAGNVDYECHLERVNGDLAGVYKHLKDPDTYCKLLKLNSDALYVLHGKKDQEAYVAKKNDYFNALGESLGQKELLIAVQELHTASKGKMTQQAAAICLAWVDVIMATEVALEMKLQLSLVYADCHLSMGDKVRAKSFLNEAYMSAMQQGNQGVQQYIKKKLEDMRK